MAEGRVAVAGSGLGLDDGWKLVLLSADIVDPAGAPAGEMAVPLQETRSIASAATIIDCFLGYIMAPPYLFEDVTVLSVYHTPPCQEPDWCICGRSRRLNGKDDLHHVRSLPELLSLPVVL